MSTLEGKVAVVAGATRGAGRAIAITLAEAGAVVYVTGRSTRGNLSSMGRTETIDETADMIRAKGGTAIPIRVDHTVKEEVKALFSRIKEEQNGRLDILVNDIWGGDPLSEWGKSFWELSTEKGLKMQQLAVHSHILTSRYGAPLMVAKNEGIIFEITDGNTYDYRGNLFYSLAKISAIHLAEAMAADFKERNLRISSVAVTPGFLRSEAMLEGFSVTEANWQDGAKKDPHFIASETPFYLGRAITALASDPKVFEKSGKSFTSWDLAEEYGFTDINGSQPNWGRHFKENILGK